MNADEIWNMKIWNNLWNLSEIWLACAVISWETRRAGSLLAVSDPWLGWSTGWINPLLNALADKLQLITRSLAPCHYVRGNLFSFAQICLEFSYLFEHPLSKLNIELATIIFRRGGCLWMRDSACLQWYHNSVFIVCFMCGGCFGEKGVCSVWGCCVCMDLLFTY